MAYFVPMPDSKPLTRMYFSGELAPGRACTLPPPQAHHAVRVLRLAAGDAVTLFNGDGCEYAAVLERVQKEAVSVQVLDRRVVERESALGVTLGQALSSGERMDYTVQKAVELGVAAVQPLAAGRSVVRLSAERADKRLSHWRSVAIAACEQCGRNRVPEIAPPAALGSWLARGAGRGDGTLRLLLSPGAVARLRDVPRPGASIILLAGPEGGFMPEEEAAAQRSGFLPVRLGPRVLRTETAAIAALAAMQALWGDF
jgi:16S rRNA (uracil1498-N3)-methyltransferase